MSVVAVVPTYRPTDSLVDLVHTLLPQVEQIVLSDDASPCTFDSIFADLLSLPKVVVVRHRQNQGIARGLNDGLDRAGEATWLLTIDQDSRVGEHYVRELLDIPHDELTGAIGPESIRTPAGLISYPTKMDGALLTTAEILQTGALWSVFAMRQIGRFNEEFGIDAVDAAACLALRSHGYRIQLSTAARLDHELGKAAPVRIFGRDVLATHHAPARRTTMIRNRLRLFPAEFRQSPHQAMRSLRRVGVNTVFAVTIEQQRWAKAKASARGLWQGLRG